MYGPFGKCQAEVIPFLPAMFGSSEGALSAEEPHLVTSPGGMECFWALEKARGWIQRISQTPATFFRQNNLKAGLKRGKVFKNTAICNKKHTIFKPRPLVLQFSLLFGHFSWFCPPFSANCTFKPFCFFLSAVAEGPRSKLELNECVFWA